MSIHDSILRVMSGEARGIGPAALRGFLSLGEPIYRGAIAWRNRRFDRNPPPVRRLPKPVISIGNLTTGGTGKTPIVRWLAAALRERGRRVAILSRGYKAAPGSLGDEQQMLRAMLGESSIEIECDPDRHAAGLRVLARSPGIDVFLLDDAFQHRRLHRDLDIVLLNAAEPFGYGHTLPRGLLREPPSSLRRAGVVVLTNVDRAGQPQIEQTIDEVRRWNTSCPVVQECHEAVGFRSAGVASHSPVDRSVADLQSRRVYCFSGLGSPAGFEAQVRGLSGKCAGQRRFPDHHAYSNEDLRLLQRDAAAAGADLLITTEKDWVKLAPLPESQRNNPPIWRLDVEARFESTGAADLLAAVEHIL